MTDGTEIGFISFVEVVLYSSKGNLTSLCMKSRCVIADYTFMLVGDAVKTRDKISLRYYFLGFHLAACAKPT